MTPILHHAYSVIMRGRTETRTPVELMDYRGIPSVRYTLPPRRPHAKTCEVRMVSVDAWKMWEGSKP